MRRRWVSVALGLVLLAEVLLAVTGGSGLRHLIVAVIVVELALAVWAVFAAVRAYASLSALWSQRIEAALAGPLPRRIARLITLELSLARGVWLRWGGRPDLPIGATGLQAPDGEAPVMGVLIAVMAVEAAAVHTAVPWHRVAAFAGVRWLVLALSLYGIWWAIGWVATRRAYPHVLTADMLHLRVGPLTVAEVPWRLVSSVTPIGALADPPRSCLVIERPMAPPNVRIELAEPVRAVSLLGAERQVTGIALALEHPSDAVAVLKSHAEQAAAT